MDEILIMNCGTAGEHMALVRKRHKKIDDNNLRLNLPTCHSAKMKSNSLITNLQKIE